MHTFALSPGGAPSLSYLPSFSVRRRKVIYHRVGFRDEDGDDDNDVNDGGWPVKTISTIRYGTVRSVPTLSTPPPTPPLGHPSSLHAERQRLARYSYTTSPASHTYPFLVSPFLFLSLSTLRFTPVSTGRSRECTNSRLVIYLSVRACVRTCLLCRVVSCRASALQCVVFSAQLSHQCRR